MTDSKSTRFTTVPRLAFLGLLLLNEGKLLQSRDYGMQIGAEIALGNHPVRTLDSTICRYKE